MCHQLEHRGRDGDHRRAFFADDSAPSDQQAHGQQPRNTGSYAQPHQPLAQTSHPSNSYSYPVVQQPQQQRQQQHNAWYNDNDYDYYSGTNTDTSSDDWGVTDDSADVANLPPDQQAEQILFQYRHAKRRWRQFTEKPVRRIRRFVRRKGGKGGGKSRRYLVEEGPIAQAFVSLSSNYDAYFQCKGKARAAREDLVREKGG